MSHSPRKRVGSPRKRVGLVARAMVLIAAVMLAVAAHAADWTRQTKLLPNAGEGLPSAYFGQSVAIDGHIAFVGAPKEDQGSLDSKGAAYVFQFDGTNWMPRDYRLTASDGTDGDHFGNSLSISGNPTTGVNTAIIGAFRGDLTGMTDPGAAYIFQDSGSGWSQLTKLTAQSAASEDYFGNSVSISGNTAIVGAYKDDNAKGVNAGSAYIFQDSGSGWAQVGSGLVANDGAAGALFGTSVAIDGDLAVVGAFDGDDTGTDPGAAYVFQDQGGNWVQIAKLTASAPGMGDGFGTSVAISGNTVLVGAPYNDFGIYTDPGAVYAYVFDGVSTWTEKKLNAGVPGSRDYFGYSVDIDGDALIVGAYSNNNDGNDSGSSYVFEDSGSGFTIVGEQTANDAALGDQFGYAVAISGGTAVVGANSDDDYGSFSGSAYILGDDPEVPDPPDPPDPPEVPEPAGLVLALLAGLGLFGVRRNRKA